MTKEEIRKQYMKAYNANRSESKIKRARERRLKNKEEYTRKQKEYHNKDLNRDGVTKTYIRNKSYRILKRIHTKLLGYEIHHCFGYEDAEKFIYIPRELHLKIHQFLRDNNIPAHIEHFNSIRGLISSYPGYTYIRT